MTFPVRSVLAGLALLCAPGCVDLRVGQPIPKEQVQEVREGFTTRDRVLTLFGSPLRKVPNEDGEIWVYRYMDGERTCQELVITFTGDAVSTVVYH
ncbi:MAG: outer membrane protein assembly factor BamE [Planctomycetes bacterium]|nr:outer membrane protein assembly factor BamE [Planctomycetota bacterium]